MCLVFLKIKYDYIYNEFISRNTLKIVYIIIQFFLESFCVWQPHMKPLLFQNKEKVKGCLQFSIATKITRNRPFENLSITLLYFNSYSQVMKDYSY